MSQQVYSSGNVTIDNKNPAQDPLTVNRVAPARYLPSVSESDTLTLQKNNGSGTGAFGSQNKTLPSTGTGLYFNRLNGTNVSILGNVVNYNTAQSSLTKPYWIISANSTIDDGATILYSKVDNLIAVNCVIPINFGPPNTGLVPFKVMLVVRDSSNVAVANYALTGNREVGTGVSPDPYSLSAIVPVRAGQNLGVYGYATNNILTYGDDLNGNPSITVECMLQFTKL